MRRIEGKLWLVLLFLLTDLLTASLSGSVFRVTNADDSGPGSFREAILYSNQHRGFDRIYFSLPGLGVKTIRPLTALPVVKDPVLIDGATDSSYVARPRVVLDGSLLTSAANGLLIMTSNCVIRALCICGFPGDGIRVEGGGNNVLIGNFIGTDANGSTDYGNRFGGITIFDSANNRIGGKEVATRNLVSGSNLAGILIQGHFSTDNRIEGNYIGTDAEGLSALGSRRNGIVISGASGNWIGGPAAGRGNLISGNHQSGIYLLGPDTLRNRVQGNLIGTDCTGIHSLGNDEDGITVYNAGSNFIGSSQPLARNVLSGNNAHGVLITGLTATNNALRGNLIGTDITGTAALPNGFSGLALIDASFNQVGGTAPQEGNLISGNLQHGVAIVGSNAVLNLVMQNRIGTDIHGARSVSNHFNGILISGSPSNRIGGVAKSQGNLISGNGQNGIQIVDETAVANELYGNLIGIDATGSFRLPNANAGVRIESPCNAVGGLGPGHGNVISGNHQSGIYILGPEASNNVVQANFIGTDVTGAEPLGNSFAGVGLSDAGRNIIGGLARGAGNLISANQDSGIYLLGETSSGNSILGNYIGTDRMGATALGNRLDGVTLYGAPGNQIGKPLAGNLISGNRDSGVFLLRIAAVSNIVQANTIGFRRDRITDLGNRTHGVQIDENANFNVIGGLEICEANRIGFSELDRYDGVRVHSGSGNCFRGNQIFANRGLGIDLGPDGTTANDAADTDDGANLLQNFPVVLAATLEGEQLRVNATLNSRPYGEFILDFYANPGRDPSGYGQGMVYLGETTIRTDASGNAEGRLTVNTRLTPGSTVAATATDLEHNTSEFSKYLGVTTYADEDADNIPDDYERLHDLNPGDAADALQDSDRDGLSNIEEYEAGTDPRNPASTLRLSIDEDAEHIHIRFSAVSGNSYQIEYQDVDLATDWHLMRRTVSGSNSILNFPDELTPHSSFRIYRLRLLGPFDIAPLSPEPPEPIEFF